MKRDVIDLSGFCRFPGTNDEGHRHCTWGLGIETPSAIVTCSCPCHARHVKVIVPKGQATVQRKIVAKK